MLRSRLAEAERRAGAAEAQVAGRDAEAVTTDSGDPQPDLAEPELPEPELPEPELPEPELLEPELPEPELPEPELPEPELMVGSLPSTLPTDEGSAALADLETGLFNENFFHVVLETRIASARRHLRPLAVVLIDVVHGLANDEPEPLDPCGVADVLMETLRDADTACRLDNGYFALLLEDTPETGAIWTVERIRRQLVADQDGVTVWAGIACYPAHALAVDSVLDAADRALIAAREWRQDRIEVATATE